MKRIIFISFLQYVLASFSARDYVRIIDGQNDVLGARPYMVSLQRRGHHFCGGTIITTDTVLTAAHCIHGILIVESIKAVAGLVKLNRVAGVIKQERNTIRIYAHPDFKWNQFYNDVGIVKLQAPFLMNSFVRTINMPPDNYNTSGTISGWGATQDGGKISNHLKSAQIKIISNNDCKYYYGDDVANSWLCAKSDKLNEDSCTGDSGGPLVCGNSTSTNSTYICGIVAAGNGCGFMGEPAVYTRVSYFNGWINDLKGTIITR